MKVTHNQIPSPTRESDHAENNKLLNMEILGILRRAQREQRAERKNNKNKISEQVSKEDMPCNKPRASTRPGKKKMVKACEGGKEKIVHFGAKGYGHNYSPKARKSFKARHKCGEKKSKLSAQYWACKNLWAGPKGSKASCPSNRQCKK